MTTFEEAFSHPDIQALLNQHPKREAQLRACVAGLCNDTPPVDIETLLQAIGKAFAAITGQLRIFISYKRSQHAKSAHSLFTTLSGLGNDKYAIFLDDKTVEAGRDWYASIVRNLQAANCLILLVPDDNEREWPIFEAGIFMGRMLPGQRLICLYHPDVAVPGQLAMFQGYKANKLGVQELLRKALLEPNFVPGMPAVNPNCEAYIELSAATIVSEFTGPLELRARPTMFYITLELSAPGHLSGPSELLRARVIKAAGLQQMFGYNREIGCELSKLIDVSGGVARHDSLAQ